MKNDLETTTLFVNEFNNFLSQYNLSKNKYICLVPGVGKIRPHRAWPIENWIKLKDYLLEKNNDCKIVFLGGKDEEKLNSFSGSNCNKTINLIGKLSLIETAKIISQAKELISCDTGLLHLASALGTKVTGIYGPTEPERSGPFSKNCSIVIANNCECKKDLKYCKKTNDSYSYCMKNLTVDHLMDKLKVERVLI